MHTLSIFYFNFANNNRSFDIIGNDTLGSWNKCPIPKSFLSINFKSYLCCLGSLILIDLTVKSKNRLWKPSLVFHMLNLAVFSKKWAIIIHPFREVTSYQVSILIHVHVTFIQLSFVQCPNFYPVKLYSVEPWKCFRTTFVVVYENLHINIFPYYSWS